MTEANGGLVGAASAVAKVAKTIKLPSLNKVALWLVFFAGTITVLKKAGVNIETYPMLFGVALGIAALMYEMTASKDAVRAWYRGQFGSTVASGFIWAVAFGFGLINWIGAATESQAEKTNLHKTAFQASENVKNNLKTAEDKVARLRANYDALTKTPVNAGEANLKPWTTPQEAKAAVDTAEAHKWFRENTQGCTVTKGAQTREFCANYQRAKAEVARWDAIAKLEQQMGDAEAELKEARAVVGNTKLEVSEARSDNIILTKYAGMSEFDAQTLQGLMSIVVISVLLSFGSMRAEFERLSEIEPRRPFGFFRSLRRVFFGGSPEEARQSPNFAPTAANAEEKLSLRDAMNKGLLALPRAA